MSDLQQWSAEEWERHKRIKAALAEIALCPYCERSDKCYEHCKLKAWVPSTHELISKAREALR